MEASKRSALPTYEGYRGYQPLLVQWAETGLVLADEFRDGNVPASVGIRELVDRAYASLPARAEDAADAWQVSVRSDSAAYEQDTLDHRHGQGWRFAVSADMSRQLHAEIAALPADAWTFWTEEQRGIIREWAEVPFVPRRRTEQKDTEPYRYLAIRVRTPQGVLFGDGGTVKHFAVVTNDWHTDGQALLAWQRGKAGVLSAAKDRARQRRPEERAGGRGLPVRHVRRQCRLAAAAGLDPQPARAARGDRPRCAVPPGPAEAAAVRHRHPGRAGGPPRPRAVRAPDDPRPGGRGQPGPPPPAGLRLGRPVTAGARPAPLRLPPMGGLRMPGAPNRAVARPPPAAAWGG